MKKVSRRAFSGAMLSVPALAAQDAGQPANPGGVDLPPWQAVGSGGGDRFEVPGPAVAAHPVDRAGPPRKYFAEWLPALFERTLEIDDWSGEKSLLRWIFTGPSGGFTVEAGGGKARLAVRYNDSPGLARCRRCSRARAAIPRACGKSPASSIAAT